MSTSDSYDKWAASYDAMKNKTRDLEAGVLRQTFLNPHYGNIIELGCGTGKNTNWLAQKADHIMALDFSSEMIKKAKEKMTAENVDFIETDINSDWPVNPGWANLISCSLVLEHIENLDFIFSEASRVLKRNGKFYICELHPWKQYSGSKARFETEEGSHEPQAFVHHFSDYLNAAQAHRFKLLGLNEFFDDDKKKDIPRLVSLVFENNN
jgi:ubiquinone/menaquinone biosynthesis C-methylase UbiE